jgi:hypothetical protein
MRDLDRTRKEFLIDEVVERLLRGFGGDRDQSFRQCAEVVFCVRNPPLAGSSISRSCTLEPVVRPWSVVYKVKRRA